MGDILENFVIFQNNMVYCRRKSQTPYVGRSSPFIFIDEASLDLFRACYLW